MIMSKKKVVVSLGHDALGYTTLEQLDAVQHTAKALADLVEADYQLTITHSNGPQVSMIHKAMTELRRIYTDYTPAPMCVCSAMSQGYVGFLARNPHFGWARRFCACICQRTIHSGRKKKIMEAGRSQVRKRPR